MNDDEANNAHTDPPADAGVPAERPRASNRDRAPGNNKLMLFGEELIEGLKPDYPPEHVSAYMRSRAVGGKVFYNLTTPAGPTVTGRKWCRIELKGLRAWLTVWFENGRLVKLTLKYEIERGLSRDEHERNTLDLAWMGLMALARPHRCNWTTTHSGFSFSAMFSNFGKLMMLTSSYADGRATLCMALKPSNIDPDVLYGHIIEGLSAPIGPGGQLISESAA